MGRNTEQEETATCTSIVWCVIDCNCHAPLKENCAHTFLCRSNQNVIGECEVSSSLKRQIMHSSAQMGQITHAYLFLQSSSDNHQWIHTKCAHSQTGRWQHCLCKIIAERLNWLLHVTVKAQDQCYSESTTREISAIVMLLWMRTALYTEGASLLLLVFAGSFALAMFAAALAAGPLAERTHWRALRCCSK